ncbi:alpha/beta fold hydrolase [Lysinibacillus sp. Bpr_S20]|uniref:alpha/beta hydrolase family protein n=1 Tax=Lysinibacillus sp. Bpr_S20 TaxID=2933964 RepID=UPI0020138659|nr:alpha/beta fold hydrolase [Lysinibacillus sp. Bpr_S20]MCL1699427.1 dienelactone hydrolase family protein [Lysinibacillus sp. Bpr_S20]
MNFWDIVLIVVNFGILSRVMLVNGKTKRWAAFASVIAFSLVIVQLIAVGFRWQMVPAYLSPVILIMYYQFAGRKKSSKSWISISFKTMMLIIYLSVAVALPSLLPVISFEKPTGPFTVGTTLYHWVDQKRDEPNTKDPNDRRELMVQIWYPAEETGEGKRAPYIRNINEIAEGLEKALSIPAFAFSQLGLVKSHAYEEARLSNSESRYPVLLFSHGFSGFRNQNTFEVESLASQGYIVLGIDHSFDAAATVYPDGRIAYLQSIDLNDFAKSDRHIELWKKDVAFVLDQVEKLNQSDEADLFTGRIDTSRIGMFGHSYGGATAAQMLAEDSRIKAAINMDGTLYGSVFPDSGIGKPFLLMSADNSEESDEDSNEDFDEDSQEVEARDKRALAGGGMSMVIPHTNHMSFTDFSLFSPLLRSNGENPRQVHRIINEFSLAFFDRYVKQIDDGSTLSKLAAKYPEVDFQVN